MSVKKGDLKNKSVDGVEKKSAVKKASKKPAVKKVSVVKVNNNKKKILLGEQCFFLVDGRIIRSISELADAFDEMTDETFYHHVSGDRNDFASWIFDIFGEEKLAENIRCSSGRDRSQIVVLRYLLY